MASKEGAAILLSVLIYNFHYVQFCIRKTFIKFSPSSFQNEQGENIIAPLSVNPTHSADLLAGMLSERIGSLGCTEGVRERGDS